MLLKEHQIVHLIHVLISGPFLMYVGFHKPPYRWIYMLLLVIGILLLVAFGIKIIKKRPWSQRHVWYILHATLFSALVIYVGWKGPNKTEQVAFSLLLVVGIAAVGYHFVRMVTSH